MKKMVLWFIFYFTTILFSQPKQMDGVELQLAIKKLSVVGSVLYIAAHPDDENTALLSYFAKGKLYRTGYLSLTRGEGGQNLLGSEQGAELGIIRTQELLAARKIDGAQQFFSRAIDFGYSKSSEEAIRLWNRDSIVKDIVWVIRSFQPDIIITRFSKTQGGHGQHLASAILAEEAFNCAGNSNKYPEQLQYVAPWKPKRLFFNHFRFGDQSSVKKNEQTIKVDVGEFSPFFGKSFTEIAGISRTMHKSQAMGSSQNKGSNINEFIVTAGDSAQKVLFDNIKTDWSRIHNGIKIQKRIEDIQKKFSVEKAEKSITLLLTLYKELNGMPKEPWALIKKQEVVNIIQSILGLSIDFFTENYSLTLSVEFKLTTSIINRSGINVELKKLTFPQLNNVTFVNKKLEKNIPYNQSFLFTLSNSTPYSQAYWMEKESKNFLYSVENIRLVGKPENDHSVVVKANILIEKDSLEITVPIRYKNIDPINGEQFRSVEILPKISVECVEKNIVFTNNSVTKPVSVHVRALTSNVVGNVRLKIPEGWKIAPAFVQVTLSKKDDEALVSFAITPSISLGNGEIIAEAVIGTETFFSTVKTISYAHIPPQTILEKAKASVLKINLEIKGKSIGYIMGAGDEIPKALMQIGYAVKNISDEELHSSDLSQYDAIIAGVRAYNTRKQLQLMQSKLMKYVENGGNYIVMYQTPIKNETENIGPYPMNISRERVTDENAEMTFVQPNHSILNYPNKIFSKDFDGWIQERGLSFANTWDKNYETVLACADVNEKPLEGGLLVSKYGKGNFIYNGYALFRQLPSGVNGAYRLLANMVSIGK